MTSFMNESGKTISTYVGDEISDDREAKNVFGTIFFVSGSIRRASGFGFSVVLFGLTGLNGDSVSDSDVSEVLTGEDSSSENDFAVLLGLTGFGGDSSPESESSAGISTPSGTIHESSKSDSRILTLSSSSSTSSSSELDSP